MISLSHEILRDKFKGAILGCFLGDAFGSGFEGMHTDRAVFHLSNLSKRFSRQYTDDTDMTLALAESIIRSGKIDPEEIANQFSLYCDLTRGYAIGTIKAVLALRAGMKWFEVARIVFESGSFGNGVEAQFSVPSACFIAITYSPDFCDAIRAAISLGGDTDTIAGMVGAIVGAHIGEKGLPGEWIEQLEDGPRGRSFARDMADRLFETWWKIHQTSSE